MTESSSTSNHAPPGPKGHLLLGSLPDLRRNPLDMLEGFRQRYGDIVHFRLVNNHCYLLCHPDHIRHVLRDNSTNYRKALFFDKVKVLLGNGLLSWAFQDEFYRQRRRLSQPPFQRASLRSFAGTWVDATSELLDGWHSYAESGQTLDAFGEMMAHSLDLAARTLFSVDAKSADGETVTQAFTICLEHLMHKVEDLLDLPEWIPTPRNLRFLRARKALDRVIYRLIDERREAGDEAPDDFLTTFLRANDEDEEHSVGDVQLRDELITLFIAGFETNASALAWTLWILAHEPEFENRLREEVAEVLDGRPPTYDDLPSLQLTRMVLEESMRLYSPAWWITRAALADDEIGGYRIPAGATVVVSQHVTHRHPDFWADPDRFDPYRFTPEQSADRPPLAYFPFGDGPRTCIGKHFALIQLQIVLAMIVQRYHVGALSGHEINPMPLITMRPDKAVLLRLEAVEPAPRLAAEGT